MLLSVIDTGCGMDEATLDHIFEPFFTTKSSSMGTGLGLSIVHGIMRAHSGTIVVSSQPNQGTEFHLYFTLPETRQPVG
jgi:signal transduction histidine kinase